MGMPSHTDLVQRVKALEKRLEGFEAPPAMSMGVAAPGLPDDRQLFIWATLATFVAGQFKDAYGAFLHPESMPESTAVNAYTALKRALAMHDAGILEENMRIAEDTAVETWNRLHPNHPPIESISEATQPTVAVK